MTATSTKKRSSVMLDGPPPKAELDSTKRIVRHRTANLRPGGIPIRWRNLAIEEQHRLVDLTSARDYGAEWSALVFRAGAVSA